MFHTMQDMDAESNLQISYTGKIKKSEVASKK